MTIEREKNKDEKEEKTGEKLLNERHKSKQNQDEEERTMRTQRKKTRRINRN